jgi:hypothetical protein
MLVVLNGEGLNGSEKFIRMVQEKRFFTTLCKTL